MTCLRLTDSVANVNDNTSQYSTAKNTVAAARPVKTRQLGLLFITSCECYCIVLKQCGNVNGNDLLFYYTRFIKINICYLWGKHHTYKMCLVITWMTEIEVANKIADISNKGSLCMSCFLCYIIHSAWYSCLSPATVTFCP